MTKAISAGFAAHLATRATTLATCWKVTRTDGQIFAFTDHDQNLIVSSIEYQASSGYTRSAIQTNSALAVDNLDLEGVLDSESITEVDLRAGRWDYAAVEIFLVNYSDLSQGTLKLRKGRLGECRSGRQRFNAELRGLIQNLQQDVGRIYGPACDADLGDSRCKVNLAPFIITSTVTSVTSSRVFADSTRSEADDWFTHGKLTFLDGDNAGLSMEVKNFTQSGGIFELHLPMPFDVGIGDQYTVYAGCDKLLTTCITKFANQLNFQGFPYVPGTDQMVSGGL